MASDAEMTAFFDSPLRTGEKAVASPRSSSASASRAPASKKRKLSALSSSSSFAPSPSSSSSSSSSAAAAEKTDTVLTSFRLTGKVAVVTGGYGTLGVHMCRALLEAGARVFVLGRSADKCARAVRAFREEDGLDRAHTLVADVTNAVQLEAACEKVRQQCGRLDILVNGAGGNSAGATVTPTQSFFDMDVDAFKANVDLNLIGTVLPTKIFGRLISAAAPPAKGEAGATSGSKATDESPPAEGVIINISSMAAQRPISRVVAYSAAKSAVDSFTRWMATEMAQKVSTRIRVNAIAPGFFLADQNRRLLTQEDGSLTARGETIIKATPVGRFGNPSELCGPLVWLCSDAASFVTGIVVPVDGGFSGWCAV